MELSKHHNATCMDFGKASRILAGQEGYWQGKPDISCLRKLIAGEKVSGKDSSLNTHFSHEKIALQLEELFVVILEI